MINRTEYHCNVSVRWNAWNRRCRHREQELAPIAADLEREKAKVGVSTCAVSADVSEAHQQTWEVEAARGVYVNTVGTFGVVLASYHWSRVVSTLGRLYQHLVGKSAHTWHLSRTIVIMTMEGMDAKLLLWCSSFLVQNAACR